MSTKRLVISILVGVIVSLVVALACHALGLDSSGFVLLPLAAGGIAGVYVFKTSGIQ